MGRLHDTFGRVRPSQKRGHEDQLQQGTTIKAWLKRGLQRFPRLYMLAYRSHARWHRGQRYEWHREPTATIADSDAAGALKVRNLLSYSKGSGTAYAATDRPAGYHTIVLNGIEVTGQRDPENRLTLLPFDLSGCSVLDIGSNQGGMLFAAARRGISWGVGVDVDSRMVNVANRICRVGGHSNLDFFVHDLDADPLDILEDYLPEPRVDVVFLLSVCMWIDRWREVINWGAAHASTMLFESNGVPSQQNAQIAHLRSRYSHVEFLTSDTRSDDSIERRLLLCTSPLLG